MGLGGWVKIWWVEMEKIDRPGRENDMRKLGRNLKSREHCVDKLGSINIC